MPIPLLTATTTGGPLDPAQLTALIWPLTH